MLTGGLIENLSPSLSLASLNEVAMYSAYLATVVCEREEVQYQTWNIYVYKLTVLTDWRFLHRRNNPSNKKIWHSREKWGKSDHKNLRPIRPQRLIVSDLWEICVQLSPHLREQWLANFSQLFLVRMVFAQDSSKRWVEAKTILRRSKTRAETEISESKKCPRFLPRY